jgi:hypothetical protein
MPAYKISPTLDKTLNTMAASQNIPAVTKGDALSRAIALYEYLHKQCSENRWRVAFIDETDQPVLVVDPLP